MTTGARTTGDRKTDVKPRSQQTRARIAPANTAQTLVRSAAPTSTGALQVTPANAQYLQRTIGNRAVTDLVARQQGATSHTPVQSRPQSQEAPPTIQRRPAVKPIAKVSHTRTRAIQRTAWTTDAMITSLDNIPFLKGKLDMTNVRSEAMRDRVRAIVDKYKTLFQGDHHDSTNNAMMLSIGLESVARVIAEELSDPATQPELQQKLMELYKSDLKTQFTGTSKLKRTMALAEALLKDNPVARYMHKEMRVEEAALKIQEMARSAGGGLQAVKMFTLLKERFQAELASYSQAKIKQTEDTREAYNVKETAGELSVKYFTKIFGDVATAQEVNGKVQLTVEATTRLAKLKTHVASEPSTWKYQLGKRGQALYQQHLDSIDTREATARLQPATNPQDILTTYLMTKYNLNALKAAAVYNKIAVFAHNAPLTITVPGIDWFGKTQQVTKKNRLGFNRTKTENLYPGNIDPEDVKFRPATRQMKTKKTSEVFDKNNAEGDIEYTGKYDNPNFVGNRGENYLRFRNWKDNRQTRRLGFQAGEMPTFGAVNINWNTNRGSDAVDQGNAQKWNIKQDKKGNLKTHGVNYYGEVHFLLKNDHVANRLVYTATDHGRSHRDIMFALADFASGERLTKDKQTSHTQLLANVINAAMDGASFQFGLPLEIQIFGELNISTDVAKIYVAPGASDVVQKGIKLFSKKFSVPYEKIKAPKNANMIGSSGSQLKNVQEQVDKLVVN